MRALFLLLAALTTTLHFSSCSGSKESAASTSVDTNADTHKKSLLYEVSGNGLSKPSYIFGTIHLIDAKNFILRKEVLKSLGESEEIAFELKLNDLTMMSKMIKGMTMPEGQTLGSYMTDEEYQGLAKYIADSLSSDIALFDAMKPMYLYQHIAMQTMADDVKSYEIELMGLALEQEMNIVGLESIEKQLSLFDEIPMKEQIGWILESINDQTGSEEDWTEMVEAYLAEDIEKLHLLIVESSPEFAKYKELLIYERNKDWASALQQMMKEKSTFVAVGSGHLGGELGLLNLLREKGFTVKPL